MFYRARDGLLHFVPNQTGLYYSTASNTLCLHPLSPEAPLANLKSGRVCSWCVRKLKLLAEADPEGRIDPLVLIATLRALSLVRKTFADSNIPLSVEPLPKTLNLPVSIPDLVGKAVAFVGSRRAVVTDSHQVRGGGDLGESDARPSPLPNFFVRSNSTLPPVCSMFFPFVPPVPFRFLRFCLNVLS